MRHSIDKYLIAGTDPTAVASLVREMDAADYVELMDRIDTVMESSGGNGPDAESDLESFDWLKRAAALAEKYEARAFEI